MTAIVWVNLALAVPFLIAFIGVPLWMTFRTLQTGPGHAQAHAYLRARTALATPPAAPRRVTMRAMQPAMSPPQPEHRPPPISEETTMYPAIHQRIAEARTTELRRQAERETLALAARRASSTTPDRSSR